MTRFSGAVSMLSLLIAAQCANAQAVPDVTTLGNAPTIMNLSLSANGDLGVRSTNQFAEPFVLKLASPWLGYQYWMVVTPLITDPAHGVSGDATYENPSFAVSNDGVNWSQAPGVPCPLAPPLGGGNVNSDPSMVFVNNQLIVYYNQTYASTTNFVRLTYNGSTVSAPQLLTLDGNPFTLPNYPVSPAAIYEPAIQQYVMWYVSANSLGQNDPAPVLKVCTSYDGLAWTSGGTCVVAHQQGAIWHVSVTKDGATYKMLYAAYDPTLPPPPE